MKKYITSIGIIVVAAMITFIVKSMTNKTKYEKYEQDGVIYNNITKDDVLTYKNSKFYLNGKPFSEISFNLFDIIWRFFSELTEENQIDKDNDIYIHFEKSLKELSERGFKIIRIFGKPNSDTIFKDIYSDPVKRENIFYKAVDEALTLCDKFNMKVIFDLSVGTFYDQNFINGKWVYGEEHTRELMQNPDSKSRQRMNEFVEDVVLRYRDRKTIAMWELSNELTLEVDVQPPDAVMDGRRRPRLNDLSQFQNEITEKINKIDPVRLVNNGGAALRSSAWNLYVNKRWQLDSMEEHLKAWQLLYKDTKLDVLDIHYYEVWSDGVHLADKVLDIKEYKNIADSLGLPLMIGEYASKPYPKVIIARDPRSGQYTEDFLKKVWEKAPDYFEYYNDQTAGKWVKKAMDDIVEAEVPLVFWWSYNNLNKAQSGIEDVSLDRTPEILQIIVDANKMLKEKLGTE